MKTLTFFAVVASLFWTALLISCAHDNNYHAWLHLAYDKDKVYEVGHCEYLILKKDGSVRYVVFSEDGKLLEDKEIKKIK